MEYFKYYIYNFLQEGAGWEVVEQVLSVRKETESVLVARLVNWDASERGQLTNKMLAFLDTKVQYSVRKLGPAERTNLHVGPGENNSTADFGEEYSRPGSHSTPDITGGGYKVPL